MDFRLTYLEKDHKYFYDGEPVPGVGEIAEIIEPMPKDIDLTFYMDRGTRVHKAIFDFLTEKTEADEECRPYVAQVVLWLNESQFRPLDLEPPLYSKKWGFAGRPDVIGMIGNDLVLVDWKTGKYSKRSHRKNQIKVSGYKALYPQELAKTICLYITPEKYDPRPCEDAWDMFNHGLEIWKWRNE